MAELLVRAQAHYMDRLTQEDIDKMSESEKRSYEARSQIGDIIVVRPDGWAWGRCECLPDFLVVKLPNVKVEDVKHYEDPLMDTRNAEKPVMLKHRKHYISTAEVAKKALEVKDFTDIVPVELSAGESVKAK